MVANYRCNEIKEEAIAMVKPKLEEVEKECAKQILETFGETCSALVKQTEDYFREKAKQYNKDVFEKVLAELRETLLSQLYFLFDSQLKLIRQYTYDKVSVEIKKLHHKPLEEVAE